MTNQPNFDEQGWQIIADSLIAVTPLDDVPKDRKGELAWYKRSHMITQIKNALPAKRRRSKTPAESEN